MQQLSKLFWQEDTQNIYVNMKDCDELIPLTT
jgi:hypothetical protein